MYIYPSRPLLFGLHLKQLSKQAAADSCMAAGGDSSLRRGTYIHILKLRRGCVSGPGGERNIGLIVFSLCAVHIVHDYFVRFSDKLYVASIPIHNIQSH